LKLNIISAYLSHTNEVVAIAPQSYYVLKADLPLEKCNELVEKINSIRLIETEYWEERHD